MQKQIQFSIFLVNKPGVLSQVFRELGRAKVNVEALAMMDTTEHGVLRLTVDNPSAARAVFERLNLPVSETEVLCVTLPNRPGAAADLCERLAAAHMNIAYMYCTGGGANGKTNVVLKVPDIKKAMKVIVENSRPPRQELKIKMRRPGR